MLTTNQRDLLATELARLKMRTLIDNNTPPKLTMQWYVKWFEYYRNRIEFFEVERNNDEQRDRND